MRYCLAIGVLCATASFATGEAAVRLVFDPEPSARVEFGIGRLQRALEDVGIEIQKHAAPGASHKSPTIGIGKPGGEAIRSLPAFESLNSALQGLGAEGFVLRHLGANLVVIGEGESGILYGCLELADRIKKKGGLPESLDVIDRPAFKLRGTCIGMQKPYRLPGRQIYEYPYTDELFPFFYDKKFWAEYLDFLVDRRMNMLSLWNGHPFGSLVRLDDYPYAVEVSDEQFERNVAAYRYIAQEADKRGIWLTQMFYNILLPAPLAERHNVETQLSSPTPLAADYTRKAVAEFIEQYPNVGLHVCLGEAMLDVDNQLEWLTEVILPGVHEGMQRAGLQIEPPIMIRAHATDPSVVIPAALKTYKNLYTESKYNGESLTTWRPRGRAQRSHLELAKLGSTHVVNVHILANLEPFRYNAQRFIKRSVLAARDRLGAKGLHIYPLTYWDWPHAPDAVTPPLMQIERDQMWFDSWARYAWDPDVDNDSDRRHWINRLTETYGSRDAAPLILDASNDAGECAPRLVRRLGITEGNRQTLSLGMTLDQLVHPEKYNAYPDLWLSQAPPGERLQEYVRREWEGLPHTGETPPVALREALKYSAQAARAIDTAEELVSKNIEEFKRLQNDIHCIQAMTQHYAAKADAARLVLRHRLSKDPSDLVQAAERLKESLTHYHKLSRLTEDSYRFANSMQIGHRRIPIRGVTDDKPAYFHWRQVETLYERELEQFLAQMSAGASSDKVDGRTKQKFNRLEFRFSEEAPETYAVEPGARVFSDHPATIKTRSPALQGLTGFLMPYNAAEAAENKTPELDLKTPANVLVGYFRSSDPDWRRPPNPDFDARAHERNAAEPLLTDAIVIEGMPPLDVYSIRLAAGRHRLNPTGSGRYIVLGVVGVED